MFYNKYSLHVQLHNKFYTPGRRGAHRRGGSWAPRTPGRGKSAVGCPVHKEALHAPCACRQYNLARCFCDMSKMKSPLNFFQRGLRFILYQAAVFNGCSDKGYKKRVRRKRFGF